MTALAPLQTGWALPPTQALARLVAFALSAFLVSVAAALAYRWYARQRVPTGLPMLLALGVVSIYLNTEGLFGDVLGGTAPPLFRLDWVVFNVLSLVVTVALVPVGRVAGDRLATDVFAFAGVRELDAEVSRVVRSVGRVTTVTLPAADDIEDIEGYDPVSPEAKAELDEKTLLFPRKLTVAELRGRLATRLTEDYDVGHVDVELDEEGTVTYLAVGSRVAGIGATLGPGAAAVAVRADPPNAASPGDVVQVWTTAPARRVATGELRATAGDVVTLVVDESDATALVD